jgi:alcohol dehydrogenase (cytochrome c)/quinohemoprotein ethanol dehydrogenase
LPDLRCSPYLNDADAFARIVREGVLEPRGMFNFSAELSAHDVELIRAYVIRRAHESLTTEAAGLAK